MSVPHLPPEEPDSTRRRWIIRGAVMLLGLAIGTAISLTLASPASAHDDIISSDPVADSTIETLPGEVTLTFSAEILDAVGTVALEVRTPDDVNIAKGSPQIHGTEVVQALSPSRATGQFTVLWKVVSSDGHPISGIYTFNVGSAQSMPAATSTSPEAAETVVASEPTPTLDTSDTQQPVAGVTRNDGWALRLTLILGGGGLFLALIFAAGYWQQARARAREESTLDSPEMDEE